MSNRTIVTALSVASFSLLSIAAHADETAVAAPAAATAAPAPAPAPADARAQADDAEQPADPTVVLAQSAPAPAPAPAPVYAPPPPPPPYSQQIAMQAPPVPDREGFTIGFAIGGGHLSIEDEPELDPDTSVGLSFRLGAAVTPSFLIQGDVEATRADFGEGGALQMNFFGVSATGYLASRFYLVGGLGVAQLSALDRDNREIVSTDNELAFLFGLGVEAYQSSHFALSVEARAIGASFGDSGNGDTTTGANLLLGFQWF